MGRKDDESSSSGWSGPKKTAETTRLSRHASETNPTPAPVNLAPHHLTTLAEFRRRGDDVDCWQLQSVSDLGIDEHGILSRWVFQRTPGGPTYRMEVLVSRGQVAKVTSR